MHLLQSNVDLNMIRSWLGHASIETTNVYVEIDLEMKRNTLKSCEKVHTRMPVILAEEHHAKWLGEIEDGDLNQLLKPYPAEEMKMWPISQRVNCPKNDDPSLLEPIRV
jgi:SOS response associated peptidase (SRAP)